MSKQKFIFFSLPDNISGAMYSIVPTFKGSSNGTPVPDKYAKPKSIILIYLKYLNSYLKFSIINKKYII